MNADPEYVFDLFGVYGLNGLSLLAPLLFFAARAARSVNKAVKERRRCAELNRLLLGRVVLEGTVEPDARDDDVRAPVAAIEIKQRGESPFVRSYTWAEIERSVRAKPFQIILDSGVVVRVQADEGIKIRKSDVKTRWVGDNHRLHVAEILPGERVLVEGTLDKGEEAEGGEAYRGRRRDVYTLSGTPTSPLIISTEPLAADHLGRARFDGLRMAILASWLLLMQGYAFLGYTKLVLSAEPVTGRVVSVAPVERAPHVSPAQSADITVAYQRDPSEKPIRFTFTSSEGGRGYSPGDPIHLLTLPSDPSFREFGRYPHPFPLSALFLAPLSLALAYLAITMKYTPRWYEQELVKETGYGPLR